MRVPRNLWRSWKPIAICVMLRREPHKPGRNANWRSLRREAIDPELAKDGLDLMNIPSAREVLARYLTEPIPALGGATCYDMLASGERARVLRLFGAIRHGVYL